MHGETGSHPWLGYLVTQKDALRMIGVLLVVLVMSLIF